MADDAPGAIKVKTFTISIQTPDGALAPAQVEVPDILMSLADIVAPLHQLVEGVVRLANAREERLG